MSLIKLKCPNCGSTEFYMDNNKIECTQCRLVIGACGGQYAFIPGEVIRFAGNDDLYLRKDALVTNS